MRTGNVFPAKAFRHGATGRQSSRNARQLICSVRRRGGIDPQFATAVDLVDCRLSAIAARPAVALCEGWLADHAAENIRVERGLVADGRLCRFTAVISDRPGGLADLAKQIAANGASIKEVVHDRAFASSDVSTVNVLCTVETRNHEHFAQLRAHLKAHGVETYDAK